jgi:UDP-3-O-[3-hydroxymyristoyl] glucosamine N-acyltransferase
MIHPDTTIFPDVKLGDNIRIEAGARIGTHPIIVEKHPFVMENGLVECNKSVVIEDNVYIGANTVIQRGYLRDTIIKKSAFIGSMCNIGHDVYIGENCVFSPFVLICGHTVVEPEVTIKARVTVFENLHVGAYSLIGADSTVTRNIPQGTYGFGSPFKQRERKK